MTIKNPRGAPKEYLFKPGQSGNPGGRPKSFLTRTKVKKIIDQYLSLNQAQLEKLHIDKEGVSVLDKMIIATILSCIKVGDYSRLEALLTRAVGKSQDHIEEEDGSPEEVSKLSMGELLNLVKPNTKDS